MKTQLFLGISAGYFLYALWMAFTSWNDARGLKVTAPVLIVLGLVLSAVSYFAERRFGEVRNGRQLDTDTRRQIAEVLGDGKGETNLLISYLDDRNPEQQRFVKEIQETLAGVHWYRQDDNPPGAMNGEPFEGIQFVAHTKPLEDATLAKLRDERQKTLIRALPLFGQPCRVTREPQMGSEWIGRLIVGRASNEGSSGPCTQQP